MLHIEFFHSVLCGHCFIMSDRLRTLSHKYKNLKITHHSHPLRWDAEHTENKFESDEEAIKNLIRKWEVANKIDDKHRFNIKGLEKMNYEEPYARRSMLAIRAGIRAGGKAWDLFDLFQTALYTNNLDIADEEVIAQLIEETDLDFRKWLMFYEDPETEEMELNDFKLIDKYDLDLVPAMVIEGKHAIEGTKRLDLAEKLLLEAAEAEGITLELNT